jgi:hypothetical protein
MLMPGSGTLRSTNIVLCFQGCAYTTYGPSITDFELKYETDTNGISKVFTILTISYCLGALTSESYSCKIGIMVATSS